MIAAAIVSGVSLIGSLLSFVGIWIVQGKTSWREREAKDREAKERRANRRDEFQMRTLLELQESLRQLIALPSKKMLAIHFALHPEGEMDKALKSLQVAEELTAAQAQTASLVVRVPDEELQTLVGKVLSAAGEVGQTKSPEECLDREAPMQEMFFFANFRIGEILASLRPDCHTNGATR